MVPVAMAAKIFNCKDERKREREKETERLRQRDKEREKEKEKKREWELISNRTEEEIHKAEQYLR